MTTSTIDPELQPTLSMLEQLWGDTAMNLDELSSARQTHNLMSEQKNLLAPIIDGVDTHREIVVDESLDLSVPVYVHKPSSLTGDFCKVLLHIHGGGFVTGSAAHAEPQLRAIAKTYNCVVVSVEYRLAPEHPFPAALFDCFAALKWLHNGAETLGVKPEKIVVFGESAGGGLAAGLALYARDHSDIEIAQQILLYPMLDYRNTALASEDQADTVIWSRKNNAFAWNAYMSEAVDDSMLAYASPSYAHNWHKLPATYVCVGDIDLFYAENCKYVEQLRAAAIDVDIDVYPAAYHAFQVAAPDATVSKQCSQNIEKVLSDALR